MDTSTLAYITAATAIGVLIGHLTTIWTTRKQIQSSTTIAQDQITTSAEIAKSQIHAQVILAERMKWIADLRNTITGFVGCVYDHNHHRKQPNVFSPEQQQATRSRIGALYMKIDLLLNPDEHDHVALANFLAQVFVSVTDETVQTTDILDNITTTAQAILKREWERVKEGK